MCSRLHYEEIDSGVLQVKRISKFAPREYRDMMKTEDCLQQNNTKSLPPEETIKKKYLRVYHLGDDGINKTSDDQQLLVIKKEEDLHLWSSGCAQQDMKLVHVKKEEDKHWTDQEGEQLTVKSEDDDKPEVLQFHPVKTEDNGDTEPSTISSGPGGLDAEWQPDDHQLFVIKKEEDPHLWSSSLDQQDIVLIHLKKEEDQLCTSQEGEQLAIKREDDEKPEVFQLHSIKTEDNGDTEPSTISAAEQMEAEPNGDHCGGQGPDRNHDSNINLQTNTAEKSSDSSETEDSSDDADYWKKTVSASRSAKKDIDKDWRETLTSKLRAKTNRGRMAAKQTLSRLERRKTFPNKRQFQKHTTIRSGEEPSSLFDKKDSRKKQNVGMKDDQSFTCLDCGKIFINTSQLKTHTRLHTGGKPFHCGVCDKMFGLQGNLNQHMLIHKEVKPFACSHCDKRYRVRRDLRAHMTSHSGEKPFCCFDCGATFSRRESITRHVKLHKGETPYACDKCDKVFLQLSHLKRHTLIHLKEKVSVKHEVPTKPKPFPCEECGKKFSHKSHVAVHMIVHSRRKPFTCDVCGVTFKRKDTCGRHKIKFH